MGQMKLGMMNSPYRAIEKEFAFARRLGLSFIDFTVEYPVPSPEKIRPERVKKLAGKYSMDLVGHTCWRLPIAHEFENVRKAAVRDIMRSSDILKRMGVKKVNVHPDVTVKAALGDKFVREQHVRSLKEIIKHTKKNGQLLMLENGYPFETFSEFNRVLRAVPGLKLHLDIGHANLPGERNIRDFILKGKSRLEHVHMHDNMGEDDDHLFVGRGKIDWNRVIRWMGKAGYEGTVTLETFVVRKGKHFKLANLKEREKNFRRQLAYLKNLLNS
ncbi:MAG: sugar phosphate isomerase/epimerase [Candidatus Woesearchaeota archaeon]